MGLEFFCPMRLPKTTSQSKGLNTKKGTVYDSWRLKETKATYEAHLAKWAPNKPMAGALRVEYVFCYKAKGKHKAAEPYTLKPDWDNASKVLQDSLAALNYFLDDKQIVEAKVIQVFSDIEGVYIKLEEI